MSPFEVACSVANRAHFIRECIAIGCDTNRVCYLHPVISTVHLHYFQHIFQQNPKCGRRPVSFAIERFHYDNLEALLSDTSVCVDVEHSFGYRFTPINYLLKQISDELYEFKENCKCIELLAQHGADVNVVGKDGQTPTRNIVERKNLNAMRKGILLQCIFDHAKYIDFDDENGTVRRQVIELIPDLKLLTPSSVGVERDAYIKRRPKDFAGNETEFWQYFRLNKDHLLESYWHSALDYAVGRGLTYSVERILRSGIISTMHSLDECKEPLLTSSLRQIGWTDDANIEKCLNILLNHRNIDVNAKDKFGYTALSSCAKSVPTNVTRKLLECGAYIGMVSKWGDLAISDIRPQLLEKHFDSCITTDDRNINDELLELTFDYKNLIPLRSNSETSPDHSTKFCEMKAIECILETCTLRHLVKHPLIESFLDLKWNRLAFIFYTNFFFCTVFALLNIFHIFVFFLDDIDPNVSLTMCLMILLGLMVAREIIQILASPVAYLRRFQNYLECTLIGLVMFILCGNCPMAWRGTVAAMTILLIAYEFSVLVGSLPVRSFAMHSVMLETVATNFFKYLLFYSTIIAAFALAFCCLFHKLSSEASARNISNNETDDDYNNFQGVGLSMLKSIVMANGELDTASIEFNDNVLSYIVFVAFILLVTTVLGNLLSGLAVSDINEVRSQAQWTHLIRRCDLLARYEKSFQDKSSWLIWSVAIET